MSDIQNNVELFIDALSRECDVKSARVLLDAPISNDAQYSPTVSQIQYCYNERFIKDLTKTGSILPLKLTLHEFAHHILDEQDKSQSEKFARQFTHKYMTKLQKEWKNTILNGEQPNISIDKTDI